MTTTVWIGLEGPGACINKACNGLLSWADGAMFNFADAVLEIVNGNDVGGIHKPQGGKPH